MRRYTVPMLACLSLVPMDVLSHEGNSELIEELIVYGRARELLGTADAASEGIVGFDDIQLPPMLRAGELVEAVPGMVATQHSGTGKANQYFLRGFNLDHGTDFAAFVDGVPINMRTHGHGQGYLDLNFFIPELVETTTYRKGPYSALAGDFSSAGSASFNLYDEFDDSVLSATVGTYDYFRVFGATGFDAAGGDVVVSGDVSMYSGPWDLDEDLRQSRFYLSYKAPLGNAMARLSVLGYSGKWNSTDQVPARAIEAGIIDELGYVDPYLGGHTDRYAITGQLGFANTDIVAYLVDYDFGLYSNFTYWLEDPVYGDQFEQVDRRQVYGVKVDSTEAWTVGSLPVELRWGSDLRIDDIDEVGLYRTVARQRIDTVRRDAVSEWSLSGYADFVLRLSDKLRMSLGMRADYFDWDVESDLAINSGNGNDTLVSPKLNAAYRASDRIELYLNWGRGFHSNDVRGITIVSDPVTGQPADPVDPIVRSTGAEIGARFESGDRLNATLTAFWLELDSELLFVGDAGTTEALGASERLGIEFSSFLQLNDVLATNFSYTFTDSRFRYDQGIRREIPGAIESSAMLGLNAVWDNGLFATAKARYLGPAPLVEDGSVRSGDSVLVNLGMGYRTERMEVGLDLFNLLDSRDADITYYYASRLQNEPAAGVDDIHLHPLEPLSARLSVTLNW